MGLVRTITACLVSSGPKLCLDAVPLPATTNEVGHPRSVVDELDAVYGKTQMFRMLTYDVAFNEDAHPWVKKAPQAAPCLAILRRIAANMLALLRTASRAEERSLHSVGEPHPPRLQLLHRCSP